MPDPIASETVNAKQTQESKTRLKLKNEEITRLKIL